MLVSECISAAYREADITTLGREPTANEQTEALALLNNFTLRLFGTEFGENLQDWAVPPPSGQTGVPDYLVSPDMSSTWYLVPSVNRRLLLAITADTTVKFPATPNDGAQIMLVDVGSTSVNLTLDGNGRLIAGQASQVDTPQAFNGRRYFYRADLASWEQVSTLTVNSTLPLVADWNDLFVTYLATRLAPRNAQETAEETVAIYRDLLSRARRRYRQEEAIAIADPAISQSRYGIAWGVTGWFE